MLISFFLNTEIALPPYALCIHPVTTNKVHLGVLLYSSRITLSFKVACNTIWVARTVCG